MCDPGLDSVLEKEKNGKEHYCYSEENSKKNCVLDIHSEIWYSTHITLNLTGAEISFVKVVTVHPELP